MRGFAALLMLAGLPLIRQSTAFPIREAEPRPVGLRQANTIEASPSEVFEWIFTPEIRKVLCESTTARRSPLTQCIAGHICGASAGSKVYRLAFTECQAEIVAPEAAQRDRSPENASAAGASTSKSALKTRRSTNDETSSNSQSKPRPRSFQEKFKSWHTGVRAGVVIGFMAAGILGTFVAIEVLIVLGIVVELVFPVLAAIAKIFAAVIVWIWEVFCRMAQWYRRKFRWPQYLRDHVFKPLHAKILQLLYKEWPIIGQLKDPHPELKPYRELVEKNWSQRQSMAYKTAMDSSHAVVNPPEPSREMARVRAELERGENTSTDRRTCVICFEERPQTEFPRRRLTKQCRHNSNACLDCVAREIRRTLENSGWMSAECVGEKCGRRLTRDTIREYAFQNDVEKLDRLETMIALEKQKNFRWCTADGCTEGAIHEDGLSGPLIICKSATCKARSCFIHHTPWHDQQTCFEYQREIDGSYPDITTAEMDAKPFVYGVGCPGCGVRIFRVSGCANMTCSLCRRSFQYTG